MTGAGPGVPSSLGAVPPPTPAPPVSIAEDTPVVGHPHGRRIDEVGAAVFRAPHSSPREDVVEFSCHGGRLSAERLLSALLRAGGRLAAPGEFTMRAFLSGRVDLAQAEAVADLIHAETES